MLTLAALTLATACISSPLEPQEQVNVSPGQVALAIGESRQLTAWLSGSDVDPDSVVFSWTSSNPDVIQVDGGGVVFARAAGSASVNVKAEARGRSTELHGAVKVTVGGSVDQAALTRIFSVPEIRDDWGMLAYTNRYEDTFSTWGQTHWDRSGGEWEDTYYDRGLAWYAAWWRTGDTEYLGRGHTDVLAYRDDYVLPNEGKVPPRWVFPEGLAVHYLLTGDPKSAEAVALMAKRLSDVGWLDNMLTTQYQDGRIQGRAVLVQLIAREIGAPALKNWDAELRRGIASLKEWYHASGGTGFWEMKSYCGGQANFQVSHAILEALIRYYDLVEPDPEIPGIVKNSLDYMWSHWNGSARAFPYNTVECEAGGTTPAVDLNLLISWPFGWYYRHSGDVAYRDRGDAVFESGLDSTYWNGHKQFNQSFMRSYRYPWYTR